MRPRRRHAPTVRTTTIAIVVVGGGVLWAGVPASVIPRSSVALAAADPAQAPAAEASAPAGDASAPAGGAAAQPVPAPSVPPAGQGAGAASAPPAGQGAGAAGAPAGPAAQPAAAVPATPDATAPAAADGAGAIGGPAASWPAPPLPPTGGGPRSSAPSRAGGGSRSSAPSHAGGGSRASACLRVTTTRSCALPGHETNGREAQLEDAPVTPAAAPGTHEPPQPPAAALAAIRATRIPNFFIDSFQVPPFLLSIYQAAGTQYGVRWEVLAAINELETDYGRNLNISSAGALGWMQFMPSSWATYGVDGNADGRRDPYNPVDAIFAAARYLKAAGAGRNLRAAIFSYNHAGWYVDAVLARARMLGGIPDDLVGALTGLSQGRLPIAARARYAPGSPRHALTGIDIVAVPGAPAVAVQDGEIVRAGHSRRLGRFVMLRDAFGNTYTYGRLKTVAREVAVPRPARESRASIAAELALPPPDPVPTEAASAGSNGRLPASAAAAAAPASAAAPATAGGRASAPAAPGPPAVQTAQPVAKERLFAHPGRPRAMRAGGRTQILESWTPLPVSASLRSYLTGSSELQRKDVVLKPLAVGRRVIAGTILGRVGTNPAGGVPHMRFEIRPAGRGAPRIDPRPIVHGWRLLDDAAIDHARGAGALAAPTLGQILLMSKEALARRVLADPAIDVYACGRRDIEAGVVDRRVLATLEFLAASGLKPTVTSLRCGHGFYTASGNVSAHSSGAAVDIAKINGVAILGHQGPGSIADQTIRRLLTLQGPLEPAQIISLMSYAGAANTLALPDHADHIHVGFSAPLPLTGGGSLGPGALRPSQWTRLADRLDAIKDPDVPLQPSAYALKVTAPASPPPAPATPGGP